MDGPGCLHRTMVMAPEGKSATAKRPVASMEHRGRGLDPFSGRATWRASSFVSRAQPFARRGTRATTTTSVRRPRRTPVERPRRRAARRRALEQAPHLQVLPVQQHEDGVAPRRRELEQQHERGRHLEERAPPQHGTRDAPGAVQKRTLTLCYEFQGEGPGLHVAPQPNAKLR